MPKRILRDCTVSHRVNALSFPAEVFFYRMIMTADDFGVLPAQPERMKATLFPLRNIRTADIARWLAECEEAGLIVSYDGPDEKRYAAIRNFDQEMKFKKHRYPSPPDPLFETETEIENIPPYIPPQEEKRAAEIALRIYMAYPKKYAMMEGQLAAKRVIENLFDKGANYDQIEDKLMKAVTGYRNAVSFWPPQEKRFILSMKTFFEAGHYADDPECWRRDTDSAAPAGSPAPDEQYTTLPDGTRVRRSVL